MESDYYRFNTAIYFRLNYFQQILIKMLIGATNSARSAYQDRRCAYPNLPNERLEVLIEGRLDLVPYKPYFLKHNTC